MADLTPIPIARPEPTPEQLRGRGGVDAIAAANKVLSGVVDTSFGVLHAFLPQTLPAGGAAPSEDSSGPLAPWSWTPPRDGLTAAVAGTGKVKSQPEEGQRELVEVSSWPPSLGSHLQDDDGEEPLSSGEETAKESVGDEADEEEDAMADRDDGEEETHDTRSIKSFESMLSGGWTKHKTDAAVSTRQKHLMDLMDRLTHGMAGTSRRVQGGDSAHKPMASTWRLPPPNRRSVECTEQGIRVSEVGELLREYQRLVEAVRCAGGFQE